MVKAISVSWVGGMGTGEEGTGKKGEEGKEGRGGQV